MHPVFGSFKAVQVRNRSVQHNAEGVDQATVSIQFVESTTSAPFFDRSLAVQQADAIGLAGDATRALSTRALGGLIDTLRTLNPLKTFDSLRATMLGPILALQSSVSGVILAGLDAIAVPRAWAADLDALTGGVLDLMNPPDLFSSWRQAGNTLALLAPHASGGSSAAPVTPVTPVTPSEAQARAAVGAHVSAALATAQADAAAVVLAAEADTATLSPQQIETIANTARTALDAAIEAARSVWPLETSHAMAEALKTTALAVQDAAQAIIAARPPLVARLVTSPGNLRLIAHRWYGDHTRAPELFRLNNLRLPNFIQMGDVLNAYAR
ncbi:MAG: DNA circulation family protein [Pseudomonadota bacterium]